LNFHQIKTKIDMKEIKYILKVQIESREFRVEFFVEREFIIVFFFSTSNINASQLVTRNVVTVNYVDAWIKWW
jgi:hypothetical protein